MVVDDRQFPHIASRSRNIKNSNKITMTSQVVYTAKLYYWNIAFIFNTIKWHDSKFRMWV